MSIATPQANRLIGLDALRGVAVLGIFMMNIQTFAMVLEAYANPSGHMDLTGANQAVWMAGFVFFDMKFITVFSVLFGAGVAMTAGREEPDAAIRHFRRMGWLLAIGLVHAYALWFGDILVMYAIWGAAAAGFLGHRNGTLIATGVILAGVTALMFWSQYAAQAASPSGSLSPEFWRPSIGAIQTQTAIAQAPWAERIVRGASDVLDIQMSGLVFYGPRVLGCMLIGIALFRNGFLAGAWSARRYGLGAAAALPAGLGLAWLAARAQLDGGFHPSAMAWTTLVNHLAALAVAFGYGCVVMLAARPAVLRLAVAPFAAVGRMALTNYIAQSVIAAFLFFGPPGLGWFGEVERAGQFQIVLAVWGAQLVWSPLWLAAFRFGPLEWVWRSLTYRRVQPFLRARQRPADGPGGPL